MESSTSVVLSADSATKCLSTRLKQNVQSARELSAFLKRRATTEEESARAMQRSSHMLQEAFSKPETKQGTFSQACNRAAILHDRIADCSLNFARQCSDISEELIELSKETDRKRKALKDQATKSDRAVCDAEGARDKAKQKHEGLLEEWHRAQGYDTKKSAFSFKSSKSSLSTKQIEELKSRLEAADSDARQKFDTAAKSRVDLIQVTRPRYVQGFLEIIHESDSLLTMHLQRFARMTEDLALGQAVVVATPEGLGITNIFTQIVNSEDLSNHIESYRTSSTTTDIIPEHEPWSVGQTMDTHQGPSLFGEPLERVLSRENSPVPALVQMCVKIIDDNGLDVEGLYRLSAPTASMNNFRHTLETRLGDFRNTHNLDLSAEADIYAVACTLKQFFRELPEKLITEQCCNALAQAVTLLEERPRQIGVHQAINELSDANYSTLRHLVLHLKRVEAHASTNLMNASNLAIIFGPNILENHDVSNLSRSSLIIESILEHCHAIFDAAD